MVSSGRRFVFECIGAGDTREGARGHATWHVSAAGAIGTHSVASYIVSFVVFIGSVDFISRNTTESTPNPGFLVCSGAASPGGVLAHVTWHVSVAGAIGTHSVASSIVIFVVCIALFIFTSLIIFNCATQCCAS